MKVIVSRVYTASGYFSGHEWEIGKEGEEKVWVSKGWSAKNTLAYRILVLDGVENYLDVKEVLCCMSVVARVNVSERAGRLLRLLASIKKVEPEEVEKLNTLDEIEAYLSLKAFLD